MKWKDYKKLSIGDREEWKFRFDKKRFPSVKNLLMLIMSVLCYMFVIIFVITHKLDIICDKQLIYYSLTMMLFGGTIKILFIISVFKHYLLEIKEKKWIKERIR